MYIIKVDGKVLYAPSLSDAEYQIIAPELKLEVNDAGSLTFTLPPGHAMYDAIQKMKSIITVEQDDEEIFRGRALTDAIDFYNQKEVYCEGELAFLYDSVQRPFTFEGTVEGFMQLMLDNHNAQVEAEKQFAVGIVTAVASDFELSLENEGHTDTLTALQTELVHDYKGFLRIRQENGIRYLDYIDKYNSANDQQIAFGVNLLETENEINAKEIFTVIIPLGGVLKGGKTQTIESVNDGKDYIENTEAIAKYGRIVKAFSWENVTDAAELYNLGLDKLYNADVAETLNVKAIDMSIVSNDEQFIHLGDTVRIKSAPHGLDRDYNCEAIDIDIVDPEKTVYTFGPKKETLSDSASSMASQIKKNSNALYCHLKHIRELDKSVEINITAVDEITRNYNGVLVEIDAAKAQIALKASQYEVNGLSEDIAYYTKNTELKLDAANAEIELKVSKNEIISTINATPEAITISSSRINLQGYVTASALNAQVASIRESYSTELATGTLTAGRAIINGLTLNGFSTNIHLNTQVVTGVKMPTVTGKYIWYVDDTMDVQQQYVLTGFTDGEVTTDAINYVGV